MKRTSSPFHLLILLTFILFACETSEDPAPNPDPDPDPDPGNVDPVELPGGLTLLSQLSIGTPTVTDVWGYHTNGREYALIADFPRVFTQCLHNQCPMGNVTIVDVTDPTKPEIVSVIEDVPAADLKIWQNFLYISNSGVPLGDFFTDIPFSLIYDITDPANPVQAGNFPHSHNVFIDERGYMYQHLRSETIGVSIYDLNTNPTRPMLLWSDDTGISGHDVTVIGNRLYDFHWDQGTFIYDVTDPTSPQQLGHIDRRIAHSGWATDDNTILVIGDELRESTAAGFDMTIWDVSNPAEPVLLSGLASDTKVHNQWIDGDLLFVSHYAAGIRVYDISDPSDPKLQDEFNTNLTGSEEFLAGAWGIYYNERTGNIYISDIGSGLFIFSFEKQD